MPKLDFDLRPYALAGAKHRLTELDIERASILRVFPDLASEVPLPRKRGRKPTVAEVPLPRTKRKPRYKMSAAQKMAVSARMKKYWAARRKAKQG